MSTHELFLNQYLHNNNGVGRSLIKTINAQAFLKIKEDKKSNKRKYHATDKYEEIKNVD